MPISTAGEQFVAPCCGTIRKSPSAFARQQPSMEVLAVYTWIAKPSFVAGLRKEHTGIMVSLLPALLHGSKSSSIRQALSCENTTPAGAADGEQAAHKIRGVLWDLERPPPLPCPHNQYFNGFVLAQACLESQPCQSCTDAKQSCIESRPSALHPEACRVPTHQLIGRHHTLSEVCGQRLRRKVQWVKRLMRH
jgi:hypothetical protein